MKYPVTWTLIFLLAAALSVTAASPDSVHLSTGVVFVKGKIYDMQIYLTSKTGTIQITHFNRWEEIKVIKASNDERYLLVYHKADKDPSHKLSILDLSSFQLIKTVKPGYGGTLDWTNDGKILMVWGCGSPCACFRLYDINFDVLAEECDASLVEFIDDDIIVTLPVVYAKNGLFTIRSLKDGQVILEKSFASVYGQYYCWDAIVRNGFLHATLSVGEKGDSTVAEQLPLKGN